MTSLVELHADHIGKVSDRWTRYVCEYDRLFAPYRDRPVRLLEIGVQNGGSLEIWSRYFAQAQILVGSDIEPGCAALTFDSPRVQLVVADVNTDEAQSRILALSPVFDIVIDDGSHRSSDIVESFCRYFPRLAEGGVFVAEDLHCSYWQDYEGGLYDPHSAIAFFKRLVDVINHEHWGVAREKSAVLEGLLQAYGVAIDEEVLASIHSVEFVNSICVVRKTAAVDNVLGPRIVRGQQESVAQGHHALEGSALVAPSQEDNPWSNLPQAPEEAWLPLQQQQRALEAQRAQAQEALARTREELFQAQAAVAAFRRSFAGRLHAWWQRTFGP
ncbi:class I SAM-dependent methyltransferase [Xylophilus sp.]|uniref:class I SAM-dependent methyltransferase n=1 Tax=Xylophilus sp. TaxID=2653893 RepID=UPI0013B87D9C|nr:class I SAM-dependent methyltransferase [Xylophilus sp.]KAF1046224.1 MAG: 8-demethyl-8-alpha-L-rhamnosyl tetracenomycin-C 2'-O-methyltransferase [Xylophilus sp.]